MLRMNRKNNSYSELIKSETTLCYMTFTNYMTASLWPNELGSMGVREVVGSRPVRGNNSKESFSSNQEAGKVFFPEMPFYSKFWRRSGVV